MKRYVWFEDLDGVIYCPSCLHRVDIFYQEVGIDDIESFDPAFCPNCGQELDWSEIRSYGVKEEH